MFARLDGATGKRRRELFQQLVSELVRHEVAEEEILRPVSKRDAGKAIANARMKEESQAEELLKEMEKLDPSSAEFTAKLAKLRREVERHAEAEETKEFPRVATSHNRARGPRPIPPQLRCRNRETQRDVVPLYVVRSPVFGQSTVSSAAPWRRRGDER